MYCWERKVRNRRLKGVFEFEFGTSAMLEWGEGGAVLVQDRPRELGPGRFLFLFLSSSFTYASTGCRAPFWRRGGES